MSNCLIHTVIFETNTGFIDFFTFENDAISAFDTYFELKLDSSIKRVSITESDLRSND